MSEAFELGDEAAGSAAIPIGAVTGLDDGVRLNLTKDAVRDLPAVELEHD